MSFLYANGPDDLKFIMVDRSVGAGVQRYSSPRDPVITKSGYGECLKMGVA